MTSNDDDAADDNNDVDVKSQTSAYKPGGRGIHRKLKDGEKAPQKPVRKAGAEYRAKVQAAAEILIYIFNIRLLRKYLAIFAKDHYCL